MTFREPSFHGDSLERQTLASNRLNQLNATRTPRQKASDRQQCEDKIAILRNHRTRFNSNHDNDEYLRMLLVECRSLLNACSVTLWRPTPEGPCEWMSKGGKAEVTEEDLYIGHLENQCEKKKASIVAPCETDQPCERPNFYYPSNVPDVIFSTRCFVNAVSVTAALTDNERETPIALLEAQLAPFRVDREDPRPDSWRRDLYFIQSMANEGRDFFMMRRKERRNFLRDEDTMALSG